MRAAAWVIATSSIARAALAAVLPITPDEAYYFEWGKNVAAGYYDHPPIVALLAALGRAIGGASLLALRIPAIALFALTGLLLHALARRLFDERVALWALIAAQVVPVFSLGGMLLTPDAPHALFFVAALLSYRRAIEGGSWIDWLATGASIGAALCSKYTALLLPPVLLVHLVLVAEHRRWLRRPEPYAALALALLIFSPVLAWNRAHGFASFEYQLSRAVAGGAGPWSLWIGAQAAYVSPLLWLGCLGALARSAALGLGFGRDRKPEARSAAKPREDGRPDSLRPGTVGSCDERQLFLAVVSAPILLFFAAAAVLGRSLPHWPAAGYLGALIALTAQVLSRDRPPRAWRAAALAVGALCTVVPPFQAITGVIRVPGLGDPTRELDGWREAAQRAADVAGRLRGEGRRAFVYGRHWVTCGQLAFHLPNERVHCLTGHRITAYRFFDGYGGVAGADGVEVHPQDLGSQADPACARLEDAGTLETERGRRFEVRVCREHSPEAPIAASAASARP